MLYSEDLIEEIRQKNDIVDVISSYVKLKKAGSSHQGLCPFHSEKTPSFSVSSTKQMYHCFGCGVSGSVITFIMEYENYSFLEALKMLSERVGIALPEQQFSKEAKQQVEDKNRLLEMNKLAAQLYCYQLGTEHAKVAYRYLKERELTDETIKHFGLGYSTIYSKNVYQYLKKKGFRDEEISKSGLVHMDERNGAMDKFYNRIMFPIMDVNNRVIGFGGRVMGDGMPKYMNSPETKVFDKSRNLYGLNFARLSREKYMLICEGYMDVIALHQAGFENVVASLGTSFTGLQANLLKRYTEQVLLTYDSDNAGIKATLRAIPILKEAGISVKVINMKPYKDPDEFIKALGREEFQKRIEKAENSFYFEITVLERQYDWDDPEQKTKFYNEVAKKLLIFAEELQRNNYIEAVAKKYDIRYDDLRKLVNHYGAKQIGAPNVDRTQYNHRIKKKQEDGFLQSQKIFLTWLIEDTKIFAKIKDIIGPNDFKEEPYHCVAAMLFKQYESGQGVIPAKIINHFQSKEEQSEVASLFNSSMDEELTISDKEKAINEIVKRIKKQSLDYDSRNVTDVSQLQTIINEKTKLQKLHISLKDG